MSLLFSLVASVGFEQGAYNTQEGEKVQACILMQNDTLERAVNVSLSSVDQSATGIYIRLCKHTHIPLCINSNMVVCISYPEPLGDDLHFIFNVTKR